MKTYPIILAHGIARFDFLLTTIVGQMGQLGPLLEMSTDGLHYFKGIARHLRRNNFDVHHSAVSFAASLEQRGLDLSHEVQRILQLTQAPKVHIVAHSMGGLDARFLIARLGLADRVASLTTIGTPHLGTSIADWGLANQGDVLIDGLRPVIDLDGFLNLTTKSCREFNESVLDAEAANSVHYQTLSASEPEGRVFGPLQPSWKIIAETEGENDGLVSRTSQRWVAVLNGKDNQKQVTQIDFPIKADHLNEVGWCDLNELDGSNLFNLAGAMLKYERQVQAIYLNIANGLVNYQ